MIHISDFNRKVYTVSEINTYVKHIIDNDMFLNHLHIKGEIFNLTLHISGHAYFTLKDTKTRIKVVMFKSEVSKLSFQLEEGMSVVLSATCTVYERDGQYQLRAYDATPDGVGPLYVAFEQLKKKLAQKGYFDENSKKPLPKYPKNIGIVTSKDGAALRDITSIISRRYPLTAIHIFPVQVQGIYAVPSIVQGIEYFNANNLVDFIIIGRGGGSIEELWAFNDEKVADAIYDSEIPIISAVGHETDFTIADFVADLRASTPSAAAELCVPDKGALFTLLDSYHHRMSIGIEQKIMTSMQSIQANEQKMMQYNINNVIENKIKMIQEKEFDLSTMIEGILLKEEERLFTNVHKLEILSPLASLKRGYAYAQKVNSHKIISSIEDIVVDDELEINFYNGKITGKITKKEAF